MLSLRDPDGSTREAGEIIVLEEAREYHLVAPSATGVWLAERPLERDTLGWRLPIGLWVGGSTLRVQHEDTVQVIPVRVVPAVDKFDAQSWLAMLEAIEAWVAGMSAGLAGGRGGGAGHRGVPLSLLTESLLSLIPELERCVRVIIEAPKLRARECTDERPIHRIQAASRPVIGWIGRHPAAAQHLRPHPDATDIVLQPPRIPVQRSEDDLDHRANRYINWLMTRLVHRLRHCAADWRRIAPSRDGDGAAWARIRAEECDRKSSSLERLLRTSFFGKLQREALSEEVLLVIADDPSYARTHRLARLLASPLFEPSHDSPHPAPVRESYAIYELWSFLELQRQLACALPDASWTSSGLERLLHPGGVGSGAQYRATLPTGRVLQVDFNPPFRSHWARRDSPRWSLSAERRPDFVISASGGERPARWLFLDAKYRVSREALGEAFESVHIYRDGLRDDEHGGACVAGALLAPRQSPDTAPWFSERYLMEHRCGVFEWRPGVGGDRLALWVLAWLDAESSSVRERPGHQ